MLIDTCSMIGQESCKTDVFEPICFKGTKTMQSPCHAQIVLETPEIEQDGIIIQNFTYYKPIDTDPFITPNLNVQPGK